MRVALCCKEGLFCEALASLLDHHGSFQVVSNETSPRKLISSAKEQRAQMLVVDSFGLEQSDLQFLLGARAFGDFVIVLIVNDVDREQFLDVAVDKLVTRSDSADTLFNALAELGGKVRLGRPFIRENRRSSYDDPNELTRREYEVAQLVAKGLSNRKISVITGLREQSIKNLVSVVMRKMGCDNRVQVALRLTNGVAVASFDSEDEESLATAE